MLMIYTTLSSKAVTIKKKTLKRKVRTSLNREVGRSVSQSVNQEGLQVRPTASHPAAKEEKTQQDEQMETKGFL
jgi:hypothetical protein